MKGLEPPSLPPLSDRWHQGDASCDSEERHWIMGEALGTLRERTRGS